MTDDKGNGLGTATPGWAVYDDAGNIYINTLVDLTHPPKTDPPRIFFKAKGDTVWHEITNSDRIFQAQSLFTRQMAIGPAPSRMIYMGTQGGGVCVGSQPQAPLCQIAGRVTSGSLGLQGAVMSGLPGNPVTDATGAYTSSVVSGWSGTVSPSKAGFTFVPVSRNYTSITSNQSGQDYAATPITYTITGRVTSGSLGLQGVVIGGLPGNPVTNSNGDYSASVAYGWSGTATPSKAGYTFVPLTRAYSNVTASQSGQDYAATENVVMRAISGRVTSVGGSGLAGVAMGGLPGNPSTDGTGAYNASVSNGWSGRATPSKAGYIFAPGYVDYSGVGADMPNQNYSGSAKGAYVSIDPTAPGY
jgi:hypothetical protein